MAWTTLTLQVTTPLFNGGADPVNEAGLRPRDEEGVRVASIRGAMRFWFRALAGALTGPKLELLASMERRVFGGVGSGHDDACPSPLLLRIPRQPSVIKAKGPHSFLPSPVGRNDDSRWILYLMGQGLADLGSMSIRRPYVDVGQQFDLKVGFRHAPDAPPEERAAIESLALASLWLVCTYGGLGARTRRGFGGVRIINAAGTQPLPEPWTKDTALITPWLDHYATLDKIWPKSEPLNTCMKYMPVLARDQPLKSDAWQRIPGFPVFSKDYAPAGLSGGDYFRSWQDALIHAGEQLRYFRAPLLGQRARDQTHTPEWKTTVRGQEIRYPVGALGLPVVMKDNYVIDADGQSAGDPVRRRASPLWIRAIGAGTKWRLFSFAFQSEFLPAEVHLRRGAERVKALEVSDEDVKRQTDQWIRVMRRDRTFVPYRHQDGTIRPDESRQTGKLGR